MEVGAWVPLAVLPLAVLRLLGVEAAGLGLAPRHVDPIPPQTHEARLVAQERVVGRGYRHGDQVACAPSKHRTQTQTLKSTTGSTSTTVLARLFFGGVFFLGGVVFVGLVALFDGYKR